MKLSDNFTLKEFEYSATALAKNITNKAPEFVINNLKELCLNILEPLRTNLNKPIIILSGYRCRALNTIVGGVDNSQHLTGCAADITVENMTHLYLFNLIKNNFEFDQLILEFIKENNPHSGWVHVSWSGSENRNQCLKIS